MAPMLLGGTRSIVAVDRRSREMGAAIVSQSFSVGSKTIWSEPGVGIVVAQGTVEPGYGPLGLALLKHAKTPPQALKSLLATDPRPSVRQVMIIDSRGRTSAHTGKGTFPEAGFLAGRGFCVQANLANAKRGWRSMGVAFRGAKGSLAERLLLALEAGEHSSKSPRRGGRPRSAALMVVSTLQSNTPWEGTVLDLRVEDSDHPLRELRDLVRIREAYDHAANGEETLGKGDLEKGSKELSKAMSLAPKYTELKLQLALGMMTHGDAKKARSMMRSALGRGHDMKGIMREFAARGIIPDEAKTRRSRRAK